MRIIGGKDCAVRGYCLSDRLWSNSMVNVIRKHPWCIFRTQYSDPRLINVPVAKLVIQRPGRWNRVTWESRRLGEGRPLHHRMSSRTFQVWSLGHAEKDEVEIDKDSRNKLLHDEFLLKQLNTYSGDNPSNVQGRLVLGMSAGPECFRGVTLIMIHRDGICRDTFGEIYEMCGPLKSERNCPVGIHQNTLALR